jgi:hypothetical protein
MLSTCCFPFDLPDDRDDTLPFKMFLETAGDPVSSLADFKKKGCEYGFFC